MLLLASAHQNEKKKPHSLHLKAGQQHLTFTECLPFTQTFTEMSKFQNTPESIVVSSVAAFGLPDLL